MSDTVIYMIENTADNTFWTNNGWRADHGTLYRAIKPAQKQIESGKLAMFIGTKLFDTKAEDVKISKFNLTRAE